MDCFTKTKRSAVMRAVRCRHTAPEMTVRRVVRSLGFRYRLHQAGLAGKPDLVFLSRRKVIFVHGCFWHMHSCRRGDRSPVTNAAYWRQKRLRNRSRDRATLVALRRAGWDVLIVWECQTKNSQELSAKLSGFLQ